MLAPRRPNTPVQVLGRSLSCRNDITTSDEFIEKGREDLVGGEWRPRGQSVEMLKGMNGSTSNFGQEQPDHLAELTTPQAQPSPQRTYTLSVPAGPSATSGPEGGARVEIESLPGQNQNKPSLDDARVEAPVLPGINQDTSNMGEPRNSELPAAAATPSTPPSQPAITVNKPLPGQNQGTPIMDEPAPPPAPAPPAAAAPPPLSPSPPSLPPPAPSLMTISSGGLPTTSVQAAMTATSTSSTILSAQTLAFAPSSSLTLSPVTSFVTITRSEQGKDGFPVTLALSSTQPLPTASADASTTTVATPQAIAIAQSFSGVLSSIVPIAVTTLTPTGTPNAQDGSTLHPTARTLLIMFVVLGALSILVAIIIFMMVRSHRKHRAQQQSMRNQYPYDVSGDRIGVTTHISADPNDNPFLTASEKAIIDRAASPDGASEGHDSSSFSDAVSSFVKKSRSLAYKISP